MANMLYNGVELPDIDVVWTDKVTYPYAVILSGDSEAVNLKPYKAWIVLCKTSPFMSTSTTVTVTWEKVYYMDGGGWVSRDNAATGARMSYITDFIWTSVDLSYDSTVYLPASDPVDPNAPTEPAWKFNLRDFLSGIAAGAASRGVLRRTPIAYLYNGVQLPALPDEILAYPHITMHPSGNNYVVRAYKEKPSSYEGNTAIFYGIPASVETDCLTGNLNSDKTGWSYTTWTTGTSSLMYYKEEDILNTLKPIFWTNTDIYDLDGSLWLSASEPVPVYGGGN